MNIGHEETGVKKTSWEEMLFLVVFGAWLLILNLSLTNVTKLFPYKKLLLCVNYAVFFLLIFHLIRNRHMKLSNWVWIIVFLVVSLISGRESGVVYIFPTTALIVAGRNMDYKKVFKVYIAIAPCVLALAAFCATRKMIPSTIIEGERQRYALGYTYVSFASHIVLFLTLSYIAIRKRIHIWELAILGIANYVIYQFTDTRVSFYIAVLILGLTLICRTIPEYMDKQITIRNQKVSRVFQVLFAAVPGTICIVSYLLHWFYDENSQLWVMLNNWLSTRLALGHQALLHMQHTLFGQEIVWKEVAKAIGDGNYFYVDNFYMHYELKQGIIYLLLILIGYTCVMWKAYEKKNVGIILGMIGILLFGIMDPETADLRFQPFVLLIGWMMGDEETAENVDGNTDEVEEKAEDEENSNKVMEV